MREREELSPRLRVWLEKNGVHVLGKGGGEILEAIEKHGSISSASKALGMSYRYVWGYVKKIEKITGKKVVKAFRGGKKGGKAELTDFGRELLREFRRLEEFMEISGRSFEDEWGLLGVKLSARNRLKGRVKKVIIEGVAGKVEIEIETPVILKSLITSEAIRDMDLKEGDEVFAIIKSTEIMIVKKIESANDDSEEVNQDQAKNKNQKTR